MDGKVKPITRPGGYEGRKEKSMYITLKKAMRILDDNEPWALATEDGEGWLFYYDGKVLRCGTRYGLKLDDLLSRECLEIYEREARKHWSEEDRKEHPYMELESGLAFIVTGRENGTI